MTERYHALLIGIDAYPRDHKPLSGCVNDIDAVQRILLDDLGLAPADITRLDAPRPDTTHDTRVPRADATRANLRRALAMLAGDRVSPGDRVFIYYSGHGTTLVGSGGGRATRREALVPMDSIAADGAYQLVLDDELNQQLAAIAARTSSVSIVLDCCFGAGVTRGGDAGQARFLELPPGARIATTRGASVSEPLARGIADCHVVAACLAHETSCERVDDAGAFGVFSRAFTLAVGDAARAARLRGLTWAEIWQPMRAIVDRFNPAQHAWMEGSAGSAVFGGPPVDRDPGFAVYRGSSDDAYHIAAGSLVDITPGAVLAVYGAQPSFFSWLGSNDDLRERVGELDVIAAEPGTATATPRGAAFALPGDARARLIEPGVTARLPYAIEPADRAPAAMRDGLAGSPLLAHDASAIVRLVQHGDHWLVTDDVHGTGRDGDGRPVLFAIPAAAAARAHRVLEHYAAYARPLAMARTLAGAGQRHHGGLVLRVMHSPPDRRRPETAWIAGLPPAEGGLPEHEPFAPGAYALTQGDPIAIVVDNTTARPLRVALFNASASGRVQLLGDQAIRPGEHIAFWNPRGVGEPFWMHPPDGEPAREAWIERVIAIGRSEQGNDLGYLKVPTSLRQALDGQPASQAPSVYGRTGTAAHWTAAQAVLTIHRR